KINSNDNKDLSDDDFLTIESTSSVEEPEPPFDLKTLWTDIRYTSKIMPVNDHELTPKVWVQSIEDKQYLTLAEMTLPTQLKIVKRANMKYNVHTVITLITLDVRCRLGPFISRTIKHLKNLSTREINNIYADFLNNKCYPVKTEYEIKLVYMNPDVCNWVCFLHFSNSKLANCEIITLNHQLYIVTSRVIKCYEELVIKPSIEYEQFIKKTFSK
ncbi:hypothetical protein A3Q56_07632, partial [Intoshia linei]